VALDGRWIGGWQRTLAKGRMTVAVRIKAALAPPEQAALEAAGRRLGSFLGLPVLVRTAARR
jgi:hypothetical protein